MRILYLALDCPLPTNNGLRMRTWATLRALHAEGCRVVLVCQRNGADSSEGSQLRAVCESVWLLDHRVPSLTQGGDWAGRVCAAASRLPYAAQRMRAAPARSLVRQLAESERLDAVVCDTVYTAVNVPDGVAPLMVNHHNIEHRIFDRYAAVARNPWYRCAAKWEGRKVRSWEIEVGRRTSVSLVCSPLDRDHLLAEQPEAKVVVAPNIVEADAAEPADLDEREDRDSVLFHGALDWFPNRDAVEYFLDAVWPQVAREHPRATFVIVGRNPPPAFLARHRFRQGVEITGTVQDIRPYVRRAAVCVVPLRIGSGTRLKILEAAAMGKAIVASPLGAEGLEFEPGREILLASSPAAFAASVCRLLRETGLRRALGEAARARVQAEYGFAALREAVRTGLALLPAAPVGGDIPARVVHAAPVHP